MNTLLLASLALVSAGDYLEFPIFSYSTSVTVPAKNGSNSVTLKRENRCANVTINSVTYTTHLEPELGDIWIFEDQPNRAKTTSASAEQNQEGWERTEIFDIAEVSFDQANVAIPYAVFTREPMKNYSNIGGLGLGPKNSSTFDLPVTSGLSREWFPNFADRLKLEGYVQSLAFTINSATDCSPEGKLVYGAMDLSQFTGKLKALHKSPSTNLINAEFTINGIEANASLEIDDPYSYLDDKVVAAIAKKFGAAWDVNHSLYTLIASAPQEHPVLDFDGLEIRVSPADVWVQDKQDKAKWYFTVRPLSSSTIVPRRATIGANILKSAYIVYDLEHGRAAIGKAVRNPGSPVYEVFPAEGIPERFLMTQGSCS